MQFTTNEWAILLLVLVLGWLIGLLSREGAGRWRRAYESERARNQDLLTTHEARDRLAQERIAELERRPVGSGAGLSSASASAASHVGHDHSDHLHGDDRRPAFGAASGIGAAASGRHDDLARIDGIGAEGHSRLNAFGVTSYRDIVGMTAADEAALEARMGLASGTIARQRWREQAELLDTGRTTLSTPRPI